MAKLTFYTQILPTHSNRYLVLVLGTTSAALTAIGLIAALTAEATPAYYLGVIMFVGVVQWITLHLLTLMREQDSAIAWMLWFLITACISTPFGGATTARLLGVSEFHNAQQREMSYQRILAEANANLAGLTAYARLSALAARQADILRTQEYESGDSCDSSVGKGGPRHDYRTSLASALNTAAQPFAETETIYRVLRNQLIEVDIGDNDGAITAINALVQQLNSVNRMGRGVYVDMLMKRHRQGQQVQLVSRFKNNRESLHKIKCPNEWLYPVYTQLNAIPTAKPLTPISALAVSNVQSALVLINANFQLITGRWEALTTTLVFGLVIAWMLDTLICYLTLIARYPSKKIDQSDCEGIIALLLGATRKKRLFLVSVKKSSSAEVLLWRLGACFIREHTDKKSDHVNRIYSLPVKIVNRLVDEF